MMVSIADNSLDNLAQRGYIEFRTTSVQVYSNTYQSTKGNANKLSWNILQVQGNTAKSCIILTQYNIKKTMFEN